MSYSHGANDASVECGRLVQIDGGAEKLPGENSSGLKIQVLSVLRQRDCKWIVFLISCNSLVVYYLWNWSASTESLALLAYVNTVVFNVCALAVCLISIWVEQNTLRQSQRFSELCIAAAYKSKPPPQQPQQQRWAKCQRSFSAPSAVVHDLKDSISVLGLEKYEVLALLASSCLSLIVALLVAIDAIARIREQPVVVHEGRLGLGAILGLFAHLGTILVHPDAGLNHVVCKALPCPTLKGVNPILGSNFISFVILCGVHTVIHYWELYTVDTAAAFAVIGLTVASMLPLAFFTASIILQKLSHHMSEQLDKCLREALIIDGVLEFRNERFWTKSFGKLAGSLEVRVRKNANEHYVLQKVMQRLSEVVSTLSIQEFREPSFLQSRHSLPELLPLEYYVNELLQNNVSREEKLEAKKEKEEVIQTVRIEDILGAEKENQIHRGGRATATLLLRNAEDFARPHKNYLYRDVPVTNALLLGSRKDLDDLRCNAKLHCRP
ncbi:hypothetical protein TSAR_009419 [Trichomalopsis sarcophagae]|uniref:Cation efflux protein transmembrane domain-containing protein n=1 Tax=Trichomalopsis sarcophagae TaxID=543379 RepID=A0A232FLF6_9HYME|nr:hypothetical protein TSAR_009419 [Trichomalopsis sarcophagae]